MSVSSRTLNYFLCSILNSHQIPQRDKGSGTYLWSDQHQNHWIHGCWPCLTIPPAFHIGLCLVNGGAVSWSSKKQSIVALSTTEAEYVATTHTAKEDLWLCSFLRESMWPLSSPIMLYCDNQSAISLSKDGQFHTRMEHIDLHFHLIHKTVSNGIIAITYCPTQIMVVDILTKLLNCGKMGEHTRSLGLLPPWRGSVGHSRLYGALHAPTDTALCTPATYLVTRLVRHTSVLFPQTEAWVILLSTWMSKLLIHP